MRLIDADKLKHVIHCAYSDDLEILEKIDEQPTAFDVDKVLERLEKEMKKVKEEVEKGHGILIKEPYTPYIKAIEIVKGGGAE